MIAARRLKALSGKRVRLHTKDGHSLNGLVLSVHGDAIVLGHASYLKDGGSEPLSGDIVVPLSNFSFAQEIYEVEAVPLIQVARADEVA